MPVNNSDQTLTNVFGIDVGGSAIKGAIVDLENGCFATQRIRFETGRDCTPAEHGQLARAMIAQLGYRGPVGIGFPGPIKNGSPWMVANLHPDWLDLNAAELFSQATGCDCYLVNDADAAGLAEMRHGAGSVREGHMCVPKVVLVCTLGTGIGSAIFVDGHLLPNSELGHICLNGQDAEQRASDAARKAEGLSWKKWAARLQEYFDEIEKLISPDLIIVGGGVSKNAEKYLPLLKLKARIVPARLLNDAGIIGAALYAQDQSMTAQEAARD